MEEFFKILSLDDKEIDTYINNKLNALNTDNNYEEISLSDNGGDIYQNWINTDSTYLPSGMRSKGFKIDFQFIKEFIKDVKEKFSKIPIDRLRKKLNEDTLIKYFNMYIISYFGGEYNETKRKEIYGYGSLNSIGETLNISNLKGLNVARCIEKSAALNEILNFLGIDSSLVLSDANNVGHAYCLVKTNGKYLIVDPNFYGQDINGKGVLYIFEINPHDKLCSFDPSVFGDNESLKVIYNFPSERISSIRR